MITTLDLPEEIVSEAQMAASARKTTFQALVVEGLRTVLRNGPPQPANAEDALARLRMGFHFGGGKLSEAGRRRDESYAQVTSIISINATL